MDEKLPEQVDRLVKELRRRTEGAEITWDRGNGDTTFVYVRPMGSVVIDSMDGDGSHPFRFEVLNAEGVSVESWLSVDLRNSAYEKWATEFEELYGAARRSATGSAEVVGELLDDISRNDLHF